MRQFGADTSPSLLARLRNAQDESSWECFFVRYWRLIYSLARDAGLAATDAEDVVQEVVTEVFRAMPRFNYDRTRGTFRGFLRAVTLHKISDHFRVQYRRQHTAEACHAACHAPEFSQRWEESWQQNLLQYGMDEAARSLGPKTFQAFQLYALEGWSAVDTARFLQTTVAAVYVAKSRVVKRVEQVVNGLTRDSEHASEPE
jgi:RNA polymerase sigma-70 factor (ECF subfamily)